MFIHLEYPKKVDMTKKESPMFSVIIPTWNRIEPLIQAINSVVNQTISDWELIVVEDGSDDQEKIVAAIYAINDQRIRVIAVPEHHNASHARNIGIEHARGIWIALLDSDDYFLPDKLFEAQNVIQKKSITNKTIIYSQFINQEKQAETIFPKRGKEKDEKLGDYLFVHLGQMITPSLVYHHKFASEIAFDTNCIKHQDYEMLLRAEYSGADFLFLKKTLVVRVFRATNDNVGAAHIPSYSSQWYNEHQQFLSRTAQLGFLYKHVFDKMVDQGKLQSLKDIIQIHYEGNRPEKYFWLLLSTLLPCKWYNAIKDKRKNILE